MKNVCLILLALSLNLLSLHAQEQAAEQAFDGYCDKLFTGNYAAASKYVTSSKAAEHLKELQGVSKTFEYNFKNDDIDKQIQEAFARYLKSDLQAYTFVQTKGASKSDGKIILEINVLSFNQTQKFSAIMVQENNAWKLSETTASTMIRVYNKALQTFSLADWAFQATSANAEFANNTKAERDFKVAERISQIQNYVFTWQSEDFGKFSKRLDQAVEKGKEIGSFKPKTGKRLKLNYNNNVTLFVNLETWTMVFSGTKTSEYFYFEVDWARLKELMQGDYNRTTPFVNKYYADPSKVFAYKVYNADHQLIGKIEKPHNDKALYTPWILHSQLQSGRPKSELSCVAGVAGLRSRENESSETFNLKWNGQRKTIFDADVRTDAPLSDPLFEQAEKEPDVFAAYLFFYFAPNRTSD